MTRSRRVVVAHALAVAVLVLTVGCARTGADPISISKEYLAAALDGSLDTASVTSTPTIVNEINEMLGSGSRTITSSTASQGNDGLWYVTHEFSSGVVITFVMRPSIDELPWRVIKALEGPRPAEVDQ